MQIRFHPLCSCWDFEFEIFSIHGNNASKSLRAEKEFRNIYQQQQQHHPKSLENK